MEYPITEDEGFAAMFYKEQFVAQRARADALASLLNELFTTDGISFHRSAIESFYMNLTEWEARARDALEEYNK